MTDTNTTRARRKRIRTNVYAFYARNPWYKHWQSAKSRCERPADISFKFYGGRGIKFLLTRPEIEAIWNRDNAAALEKPSLDRIKSDGNYEMGNCRFIEQRENCRLGGLKGGGNRTKRQCHKNVRERENLTNTDKAATKSIDSADPADNAGQLAISLTAKTR